MQPAATRSRTKPRARRTRWPLAKRWDSARRRGAAAAASATGGVGPSPAARRPAAATRADHRFSGGAVGGRGGRACRGRNLTEPSQPLGTSAIGRQAAGRVASEMPIAETPKRRKTPATRRQPPEAPARGVRPHDFAAGDCASPIRIVRRNWSKSPGKPIGRFATASSWPDAGRILRRGRSSSARCGWSRKVLDTEQETDRSRPRVGRRAAGDEGGRRLPAGRLAAGGRLGPGRHRCRSHHAGAEG